MNSVVKGRQKEMDGLEEETKSWTAMWDLLNRSVAVASAQQSRRENPPDLNPRPFSGHMGKGGAVMSRASDQLFTPVIR